MIRAKASVHPLSHKQEWKKWGGILRHSEPPITNAHTV
nr:MAG TPA: hypothetical protein [Caudoviricetes sp.]